MRWSAASGVAVLGSIAVLSSQTSAPVVVRGGAFLDPASGRLRPVAALTIENGRVTSVSSEPMDPPPGAKVIEAEGAVLVPGLADLDVHGAPGPTIDFDYYASASLASGVTQIVINARSSWSKDQKQRASKGEIISPVLYLASPEVVSARLAPTSGPPDLGSYTSPVLVGDPSQAGGAVARFKASGCDWVRLQGDVPAPVAKAVIAEARRSGLRTLIIAGANPLADLLALRPDVVLGLGRFGQLTNVGPAAAANHRDQPPSMNAVVDSWRRARDADVKALAARLARSSKGTAIAPVFLSNTRFGALTPEAQPLDVAKALDVLPKARRQELEATWKSSAGKPQPETQAARRQQQLFAKAWAEAGGALVVASGAGEAGWPVPGFAVHQEAALLEAAGVSRADALRAAMGGELFAASKAWTKGARADFFLVDGSPLDDLSNLSRIRLVIRRGEALEPARLLAEARRAIRGGTATK